MIKGLIALFTSGIIFNPMVLLGIISGIYTIIYFSSKEIFDILCNVNFYLGALFVAGIYTIVFARVYKAGGMVVDFGATTGMIIWNFARYIISFVLSMSFVIMISIF